jgi:hypothetical protein
MVGSGAFLVAPLEAPGGLLSSRSVIVQLEVEQVDADRGLPVRVVVSGIELTGQRATGVVDAARAPPRQGAGLHVDIVALAEMVLGKHVADDEPAVELLGCDRQSALGSTFLPVAPRTRPCVQGASWRACVAPYGSDP